MTSETEFARKFEDDSCNVTEEQWQDIKLSTSPVHAHWDCFGGAAGDMMLAACLNAVEPHGEVLLKHVQHCIEKGIPELELEFSIEKKRVWRGAMGSIAATHVTVHSRYNHKPAPLPKPGVETTAKSGIKSIGDSTHDHTHDHGHSHENTHRHTHDHNEKESSILEKTLPHSHRHSLSHNTDEGPLRNWPQIRKMLSESKPEFIPPWVRQKALAAFEALALAEAETHGASSTETVFFHEVGAIDSIVDTVGTLLALNAMGVTSVSCSRLPLGQGSVWTQHGLLPVPAPATLRLLVDMPICSGPPGTTGELVTPTAAALLRALVNEGDVIMAGRAPSFTLRGVGIGAGTKDFAKHPNILRLLLGDDITDRGFKEDK